MNSNEQTPPRRRAVRSAQAQGSRLTPGRPFPVPENPNGQAPRSHPKPQEQSSPEARPAPRQASRHPGSASRPISGRAPHNPEANAAVLPRQPRAGVNPAQKKSPRSAVRTAPRSKTGKAPKPTRKPESTALSSLLKGVIYIVVILVISGTLAYYGITAGNDIFAFKKSDALVEITLEKDATVEDLAKLLYEKDVIIYEDVFVFYAKLRSKDTGFIATTETVSPSMGYDALLAAFKEKPKAPETIRVTIPEGYTVDEIIDLFVLEYGVGTREGFIKAIDEYPYDYWFVKALEDSELRDGRKYRLEGYLYPDTYYFYTTASEVSIINKFLSNFESKFADEFHDRAAELGWTIDDVIILASMIQMEAKYESDYGKVSSVFHNRLVSNKTLGKLESDATIQYVLQERTEDLTQEMLQLDSPYNTRLYAGLPPGPITNVTLYAINYALFPDKTNYFFFVSRPGGYTLFAETYAQHLNNIEAVEYEKKYGKLPS